MAYCPVGVMRQGIDRADGHHRSFEGGHTVEGQGHNQELQYRVGAQLMPGARQGHDAVNHATPGRRQQYQRQGHAKRLGPRSEEQTSELQSLMRISYAVVWSKKQTTHNNYNQ